MNIWNKFLWKLRIRRFKEIKDRESTRKARERLYKKDDPERPWRYEKDGKTKKYCKF